MKKIIWQPLVVGTVLGLLASIAGITGLSITVPGTGSATGFYNTVGFFPIILLLAAALGGPQAGVIASVLFFTLEKLLGPPEIKALFTESEVFWSNIIVVGMLMVLVGFAYRVIFAHTKMPIRLVYWVITVIAFYIILIPANLTLQSYLLSDEVALPVILFGYKTYIPQAIFDIFFTSLVFVALPERYRRPLWYGPKQASVQGG